MLESFCGSEHKERQQGEGPEEEGKTSGQGVRQDKDHGGTQVAARQAERIRFLAKQTEHIHSRWMFHREDVSRIQDREWCDRERRKGHLHKVRWSLDRAEAQEEGLEPHIERRPDHSGRHVLHDAYPRGAWAGLQDNDVPSGDKKLSSYN